MKYFIWTIGCQYNEWDGACLKGFLDQNDLIESSAKEADIIIILACSVRQTAVDRIFGRVKNWRNNTDLKHTRLPARQGSDTVKVIARNKSDEAISIEKIATVPHRHLAMTNSKLILATGCVLDADKKKFVEKGIKFFESGDFETLKNLICCHSERTKRSEESIKSRSFSADSADQDDVKKPKKLISYLPKTCSYVPIMIGCNNFCSYCAVPYVRGREKSRPVNEVINDVKNLVKGKQKDILLLGQNVNSYKYAFAELLEKLNNLDGDFKIGFISNHPKDMTDDIIEAVARLPKIKKEIHLPLQSGSDEILKAMNRPYTAEQYLKIIENCKLKIVNLVLTTDVIVGFPGETEEDFQKTLEIFKRVNFKQAYINKYSPRVGTAAFKLGDPIPWSEKQHRWRILNKIVNSGNKAKTFNKKSK